MKNKGNLEKILKEYPYLEKEIKKYKYFPQLLKEIRKASHTSVIPKYFKSERINIQGIEFGEDLYRFLKKFLNLAISIYANKNNPSSEKYKELKSKYQNQISFLIKKYPLFTKGYKNKIAKILDEEYKTLIEKCKKRKIKDIDIPIIANQIISKVYNATFNPYKIQELIFKVKQLLSIRNNSYFNEEK
jgi:hypothetical protein